MKFVIRSLIHIDGFFDAFAFAIQSDDEEAAIAGVRELAEKPSHVVKSNSSCIRPIIYFSRCYVFF